MRYARASSACDPACGRCCSNSRSRSSSFTSPKAESSPCSRKCRIGGTVETLTVGSEGMIGLHAVLGASHSPTRAICQVSGWALRMPVSALIEAAPRDGVLFDRLIRYAQARLTALSRSVACNRLHSAQQRYARWVLTTQDRVGTDEFPITQDFLAQMLGVTRPTISLVGQELQSLHLIHYAQGRLTVDDRHGLEQVSCECYQTTRQAFEELLGVERGG